MRIDPNPPGWYHVPDILNHYDNRDYETALASSLKMNIPGFYHTQMWRSAIYGQLGRKADAKESIAKLLALYPAFADSARFELKKFNVNPSLAELLIEGWRKAGLDIANE